MPKKSVLWYLTRAWAVLVRLGWPPKTVSIIAQYYYLNILILRSIFLPKRLNIIVLYFILLVAYDG